ncbi:MAG: NAD-dependent epimerase/dehydratase family protein [Bacilli bacterium]
MQVIFGQSAVGLHLLDVCLERNIPVRILDECGTPQREIDGTFQYMHIDFTNVEQINEATKDATVVYLTMGIPTRNQEDIERIRTYIQGLSQNRCAVVVLDDLTVYGNSEGTVSESTPYRGTTKAADLRRRMALLFDRAHEMGKLKVAFVRTGNVFGPHVHHSHFGDSMFHAIIQGKPIHLDVNLDAERTFVYVEDVARTMFEVGNDSNAFGQVWFTPNTDTISARQFVERVARQVDRLPKIARSNSYVHAIKQFWTVDVLNRRESIEEDVPIVAHDEKVKMAFAIGHTPLEFALQKTIKWYKTDRV